MDLWFSSFRPVWPPPGKSAWPNPRPAAATPANGADFALLIIRPERFVIDRTLLSGRVIDRQRSLVERLDRAAVMGIDGGKGSQLLRR